MSRVEDPREQATLAEEAKAGRLKRDDLRDRVKASRPPGKGRGVAKGKAKLKTSVVFRTSAGVKITAERTKGLDAAVLLGAAEEWVAKLRAELEARRSRRRRLRGHPVPERTPHHSPFDTGGGAACSIGL